MNEAKRKALRFTADIMLGKLAKWLRVLGFEASIEPILDLVRIESLLSAEIIPVTRREKFREVQGVVFIGSDHHFEQLKELIAKLNVDRKDLRPFSRCGVCDVELVRISGQEAFGSVPDFIFETASDFHKCPDCGRVYWPGSHKQHMLVMIESLMEPDARKEGNGGDE